MSDELKTLIDEEEIDGYKIRPWALGQIAKLTPVFERVVIKLKTRGIGLKNLHEGFDALLIAVMPDLPYVMQITLGISAEEAEKMEMITASKIVLKILNKNLAYLKNLLSPMTEVVKDIASSGQSNT